MRTSPERVDCAPDCARAATTPPPARTEYLGAVAPPTPALSPSPANRSRVATLLHPLAAPACLQKIRSASQSPLARDSPLAYRRRRLPALTAATAIPPIPPTTSCTTSFH